MKNVYKLIFIGSILMTFCYSANAQYRTSRSRQAVEHDKYGDPIRPGTTTSKNTPSKKPTRSSKITSKTEENPFEFDITFDNMNVLLTMQGLIAAAQRKAVEKWLGEQENNFKNEINRQLGTNHTNFKNAQRDFFKNYEKNYKRIEHVARTISSSHNSYGVKMDNEQKNFTQHLNSLAEWEILRNDCQPLGIIDCGDIGLKTIKGTRLKDASSATLARLERETLVDFENREYTSGLNKSWAQGINKIIDSNILLSEITEKHIGFYNQRTLQDKVFLMTAYLTQYNNRSLGPMSVPISSYRLPQLWDNNTLLAMGKKAATQDVSFLIFEPNYISNRFNSCQSSRPRGPKGVRIGPDNCTPQRAQFERLKKEITLEHREALLEYEEFGMTLKLEKIKDGIVFNNGSGKIGGLNSLSYSNYILDGNGNNANRFYKLSNGGWVYRSNSPRSVNGGIPISEPSLNDDDYYYYLFNEERKVWHELLLPATGVSVTSDPYLVQAFWKGMAGVARYATPLEDAIILIDGKDFNNNEASQAEAGIWLIAGFVPGGKLLKPITKITKGGLKIVAKMVKVGGKSIKLSYTTVNGIVTFGGKSRFREIVGAKVGEEAHHIIPWAQSGLQVIQKAAEWGFHMNDKLNGIPLPKLFQGVGGSHAYHPKYNDYVIKRLEEWAEVNPNYNGKEAMHFLEKELIPELLGLIESAKKSNMTLNEYFKNL